MDQRRSDNPQDQASSSVPDPSVEKAKRKSLEEPDENPQEENEETSPLPQKKRLSTSTEEPPLPSGMYPLSPITFHLSPSEDPGSYQVSESPGEGATTITLCPLAESALPAAAPVAEPSAANPVAETPAAELAPEGSDNEALGPQESLPNPLYPMSCTIHLRALEESCYYRVSRSLDDDGAEIVRFIPRIVSGPLAESSINEPRAADPVADLSVVVPVAGASFGGEPHLGTGTTGEQALKRFRCPNCGHRVKSIVLLAFHIFIEMVIVERRRGTLTGRAKREKLIYGNYFRCDNMRVFISKLKRAYNTDNDSSRGQGEASSASDRATLSAEGQQEAGPSGCQAPKDQTHSQKQKEQPECTSFECNCCDPTKTFPTRQSLLRHIRAFGNTRFDPFVYCPFCLPDKVQFSTKCSLTTHLKEDHPNCFQFECFNCFKKFKEEVELKNHLKPLRRRCATCNLEFYGDAALEAHENLHLSEPHQCLTCNEVLPDRGKYYQHLVYFHVEQCLKCPEVFTDATNLAKHMLEKHHINEDPSGDYFKCNTCFLRFETHNKYLEHLVECRYNDTPCITCGATFETRIELLKHILRHFLLNCLNCLECNQTFSNRRRALYHKNSKLKTGKLEVCKP